VLRLWAGQSCFCRLAGNHKESFEGVTAPQGRSGAGVVTRLHQGNVPESLPVLSPVLLVLPFSLTAHSLSFARFFAQSVFR